MDNVIDNITSSIDNCISEMREAAKYHASFVQDNSEMVISGLETAKEIIKEEVEKATISANKEAFKPGDKFVLEIGEKRRYFDEYSIVGTDLYVQTYLLKKLSKLNPLKEDKEK